MPDIPSSDPMTGRLASVLEALRYDEYAPAHHCIHLLSAIMTHAVLREDPEMEAACAAEITRISENHVARLARQAKASPVTATQTHNPQDLP